VAHDFNNILQTISSALELILEDASLTDQNGEFALTARTAAQRGSQLTQNLLAYANQPELVPRPIDLRQWLPKIAPTLEDAIGPTHRLVLIFAGPTAIACVDPSGLHTALLNLALNAGRAMAEGGLLRIETDVASDPSPPCVRIKICETRMGMDTATLDARPDTHATARDVSGPGLALSMAEAFATQSGGSLRLSNRLGDGTTAVLTLPAHVTEAARDRYLAAEQCPIERNTRVAAAIGV
jgi:signal transduction histidine kinase